MKEESGQVRLKNRGRWVGGIVEDSERVGGAAIVTHAYTRKRTV